MLKKLLDKYNYSIYFDFIEAYLPQGFLNINPSDPIIQKLDSLMELNDQMLIVMDLNKVEIIYTSKQSFEMLGIEPEKNNPHEMMTRSHECDLHRFGLGRSKLLSMDKDIFIAHKGTEVFSTNIRMKRPDQIYCNHLFQFYLFYSPSFNTVFSVQVNTNIDTFKMKKDHFHYYTGNDVSLFKFPDEKLLKIGHNLTCREFEILKLVENGLSSEQISEKLFVSILTVQTHRKNILQKYNKTYLTDIIFLFKDQGLL